MTLENEPNASRPSSDSSSKPEEIPAIEDAYEADEPVPEVVAEDESDLLAPTTRSLELESADDAEDGGDVDSTAASAAKADADDTTDAGGLDDEPEPTEATAGEAAEPDWANELSPQRIAVELKRIESEIRRLLENRDPRRKRKLGGTRRWLELEEDIIAWRHTGRFDEKTLTRLGELVARRHFLFRRLRFLTGTRPVWNS
ncbi:MAG: hypothetical protein PVI86_01425 [Phycisphaerae bacterium]|jgi:hypothetical protein